MEFTYKYKQLNFKVWGRLLRFSIKRQETLAFYKVKDYSMTLDRHTWHFKIAWWLFFFSSDDAENYVIDKEEQIFKWTGKAMTRNPNYFEQGS